MVYTFEKSVRLALRPRRGHMDRPIPTKPADRARLMREASSGFTLSFSTWVRPIARAVSEQVQRPHAGPREAIRWFGGRDLQAGAQTAPARRPPSCCRCCAPGRTGSKRAAPAYPRLILTPTGSGRAGRGERPHLRGQQPPPRPPLRAWRSRQCRHGAAVRRRGRHAGPADRNMPVANHRQGASSPRRTRPRMLDWCLSAIFADLDLCRSGTEPDVQCHIRRRFAAWQRACRPASSVQVTPRNTQTTRAQGGPPVDRSRSVSCCSTRAHSAIDRRGIQPHQHCATPGRKLWHGASPPPLHGNKRSAEYRALTTQGGQIDTADRHRVAAVAGYRAVAARRQLRLTMVEMTRPRR